MRSLLLAAALGACVTYGALALLRGTASAATSAPAHRDLNPLARDVLSPRMQQHGGDIQALALSVTLLQRDRTRELAQQIADEPRLAKLPGAGANELESTIPDTFFTLQDEVRHKALALVEEAARGDDRAVARAFSDLHQACVSCHVSYLPKPKPAP